MTMRCIGILLLLSAFVPGCGDDDDDDDGNVSTSGRGGSTAAGRGGSTAAGRGGSTGAGSGGSTAAGRGGSSAAGSGAGDDGGAGARMVEIVATEFDLTPDTIDAEPGETLIVTLRNEGEDEHSLEFELPDGDVELEDNVAPDSSAELMIEVPDESGDYVFYCPIAGHRQLGMEGTLTVE